MSDRTSAVVPGAGPRRFLRAALARIPLPLRGLRPRLLTSFVLVAMASSLGTGALAFREARTGVLQQSQDSVINQFRASVDAVAPSIPLAPDQSDLQFAVDQVLDANRSSGWRIMAAYGGHRAYAPSAGFVELSPEMLRSVRDPDGHGRAAARDGARAARRLEHGRPCHRHIARSAKSARAG